MEVMEDGNLMDKVHILIQRDMEYYTANQKVLQENICTAIVGGHLDFPRYASFAAVKLVLWWEEEYIAAYRHGSGFMNQTSVANGDHLTTTGGCGGIVKSSDPPKFVNLITKSAEQLLDHLHILTQEALDHADLSVLTGTIGAAALLKNCLWCYIYSIKSSTNNLVNPLQKSYKMYHEMTEALAERLLDLHCRLLSLYILQDADSLDWESPKPFCESERGSYVIQMWWLYMQGTKEDLWNTVPPKMSQRVFSGMLNETLTILTVRYLQVCPSEGRSKLLVCDISNLLLCMSKLLPSICSKAEELVGHALTTHSKILRDIHTKCQELFMCLILRGAPLDVLYKVFKKSSSENVFFKARGAGICPWMIFALKNTFPDFPEKVCYFSELPPKIVIALEVGVLLEQPQPNWSLLLKVLLMESYLVLKLISSVAINELSEQILAPTLSSKSLKCEGFLCPIDGTCKTIDRSTPRVTQQHYYEILLSISHVILSTGTSKDLQEVFLTLVNKKPNWAQCFDRRQVWNQKRPPWYEAVLDLVKPLLPPIVKTIIDASQTGASMYQTMAIVLGCFSQLWDCVNPVFPKIASLFQEILPVDVTPLRDSALLQLLVSALYTELQQEAFVQDGERTVRFSKSMSVKEENNVPNGCEAKHEQTLEHKNSVASFDGSASSVESIALAIAEALCSIDEDNKHTEQIDEFLEQARMELNDIETDFTLDASSPVDLEIMASELLSTQYGKQSLKILLHFIRNNKDWLYQQLNAQSTKEVHVPNKTFFTPNPLLYTMFHIDNQPFDQLLTGECNPSWLEWLQNPMGVSAERVWNQISQRWEFQESNLHRLSSQNAQLVASLTKILKQM